MDEDVVGLAPSVAGGRVEAEDVSVDAECVGGPDEEGAGTLPPFVVVDGWLVWLGGSVNNMLAVADAAALCMRKVRKSRLTTSRTVMIRTSGVLPTAPRHCCSHPKVWSRELRVERSSKTPQPM